MIGATCTHRHSLFLLNLTLLFPGKSTTFKYLTQFGHAHSSQGRRGPSANVYKQQISIENHADRGYCTINVEFFLKYVSSLFV